VYCTEQTVLYIKSMSWYTETKYTANKILLITELYFTHFKGTSEHSQLRLLNKQQRKEWGEGNPGMVVTQCRQNMKHEKARRSTANILWLIVCCTLFLVGGK